MEDEIRSLWERFQNIRDVEDRNRLFEHYHPLVRATRRRTVSDTRLVEDLEQEGSIALLQAIDRFDPSQGVQFETYAICRLRGIYLNKIRDWARCTDYFVPASTCEIEIDDRVLDDGETPSEYALRMERRALVHQYLPLLTARQQQVLYLLYWQGMTQGECGELLGLAQSTIHRNKTQAHQALYNHLKSALE